MGKVRIVFQGDSITDAGRDYRNYFDLGHGYPKYAAANIAAAHPETDFEFINFGISGNRTSQLFDRIYKDGIELQPDIISFLIGINDILHRYDVNIIKTKDEQTELNYRSILERVKKETNAKIVILSPYVLDCDGREEMRRDIKTLLPIVRKLAKEFADVYIPLDEIFEEALKTQPAPHYYSDDGIHPNKMGAEFIGKLYADAIDTLLGKN